MNKIDLHLHSFYSDGTDSVLELLKVVKENNIKIFSLTDHDTLKGCIEIQKYLDDSLKFINGIELTCITKCGIKCHILGYGCNLHNKKLNNLIEKGKILRKEKLEKRIEFLKLKHNIILNDNELKFLYSRESVVKTHVASILVKRGLAKDNLEAMDKFLKGCKTGNTKFLADEAIDAIKSSDGVPIWAHSIGGEGEKHIDNIEYLKRFDVMKNLGIKGLECFYSRYNKDEIDFLLSIAKKNNLLVSAGSDYHGKNKDVKIASLSNQDFSINTKQITLLNLYN